MACYIGTTQRSSVAEFQEDVFTGTYINAITAHTASANHSRRSATAFRLAIKSFNDSTTARGSLRFQYSVNNVQHPQYQADVLDAAENNFIKSVLMSHFLFSVA